MSKLKNKFNRVGADASQLQEFADNVCNAFDDGEDGFKKIPGEEEITNVVNQGLESGEISIPKPYYEMNIIVHEDSFEGDAELLESFLKGDIPPKPLYLHVNADDVGYYLDEGFVTCRMVDNYEVMLITGWPHSYINYHFYIEDDTLKYYIIEE